MAELTREQLIEAMLDARRRRYAHPLAPGTAKAYRDDCERELDAILPLIADAIGAAPIPFNRNQVAMAYAHAARCAIAEDVRALARSDGQGEKP